MGSASSQLSESQQQQIHEIVQEVSGTFTSEFSMDYQHKLACQNRRNENNSDKWSCADVFERLEEPSKCTIHEGYLTKQGDRRKNWKERFVKLGNECTNFDLEYFEKKNGQLKGTIKLSGYEVVAADLDELKMSTGSKEYGFKLVSKHKCVKMRMWLMRSESEEEVLAWMRYLRVACSMVAPPLDPDPLIRSSFETAFNSVRQQYGCVNGFSFDYTEGESLGILMADVVENQLLSRLFDNEKILFETRFAVQERITTEMRALWSLMLAHTCENVLKAPSPATVQCYVEHDAMIREQIKEKLLPRFLHPGIQVLMEQILPTILEALQPVLIEIFNSSVNSLANAVKHIEGGVQISLNAIASDLSDRESNLMSTATSLLDTLHIALLPVQLFFGFSYSIDRAQNDTRASLLEVLHRAVSAIRSMPSYTKDSISPEDFKGWTQRLSTACQYSAVCVARDILKRVVEHLPDWYLNVAWNSREYAKLVQENITTIPDETARRMIILPKIVDDILGSHLDDCIYNFVKPKMESEWLNIHSNSQSIITTKHAEAEAEIEVGDEDAEHVIGEADSAEDEIKAAENVVEAMEPAEDEANATKD